MAASFVVVGRDNGFSAKRCREVVLTVVRSYREAMRGFADSPILAIWYSRMDVEDLLTQYKPRCRPASGRSRTIATRCKRIGGGCSITSGSWTSRTK
ncbi:DUF2252 family protein [Kribbella sp. NPDC050820]|uniref:DUF2252 family protein n=1 Tax=Kribbella sp. NPDC050820 TaxID=3155408 RepID=UPI003406B981